MTSRAAVLGSPIDHSLSPVLHRAAYDSLGLADWEYDAHEVTEDGLAGFVAGLGPEWVGLSLTMPLKQVALELADEVSDLARAVGAANTLTLSGGTRRAGNTDVGGIVSAVAAVDPAAGPAVILGGGATAASALAALLDLGTGEPVAVVRSPDRANGLVAAGRRLGRVPRLAEWAEAADLVRAAAVVVSTVPRGAADPLAAELVMAAAPVSGVLLDVVYRPWPTALAAAWGALGGVSVPGLEMLVRQAAAQVEAWTGRRPDVDAMRSAARFAPGWGTQPPV